MTNKEQQRAIAWIANQSTQIIDYQWEIQHHRQMLSDYEKSSMDMTE
ncbi:MAG: hypothetical protein IJS73_03965 [Paludibacteraceae bacterium]|nr:hypothetical protein [Paludibacteraceae bacterium]